MLETITNGYQINFLNFMSFTSVILTILVIISKNPIVSVLFLIGLFFNIACYLVLLGINFIGLSYLLVYVGAVSILFLFILMLINVRISELVVENTNSIPLILIITVLFSYAVQQLLPMYNVRILVDDYLYNSTQSKNTGSLNSYISSYLMDNSDVSYVTSIMWDNNLAESTHISSIGNVMYTNYSI
ncbi:MAG: NADH-quinone oxidoreductase subunit J [Candidatus Eremiobacteraeota bacterium]|nr:NADH-quinone oxidoreductase subunit J [Candidatus Eremiobacteraeota bacterium]